MAFVGLLFCREFAIKSSSPQNALGDFAYDSMDNIAPTSV